MNIRKTELEHLEFNAKENTVFLLVADYQKTRKSSTLFSLYFFIKANSYDREQATKLIQNIPSNILSKLIELAEKLYQDDFADFLRHHTSNNIMDI